MTKTGQGYQIHHPLRCDCGADLTQPDAVRVTLSDGNRPYDEITTRVEPVAGEDAGRLLDPDGRIDTLGHHAGSECRACGEMLDELTLDGGQDG